MVNRINIFQPDAPMSYDDRIKILKERKLEETRDEVHHEGVSGRG